MKNVLNQWQQNIVAIAYLEAKGDLENLSGAIYTGFPCSLNGLGALLQMFADRKAKGITGKEGREADSLPEDFNALK